MAWGHGDFGAKDPLANELTDRAAYGNHRDAHTDTHTHTPEMPLVFLYLVQLGFLSHVHLRTAGRECTDESLA